MFPYGDQIEDVDDFYPALIESYTIDDTLYCLPKDFSTLALVINSDAWEAAGLTDETPDHWDELTTVSQTLTPAIRRVSSSRARPTGSGLHGPGRRLVDQRGPDRGDGGPPGERGGPDLPPGEPRGGNFKYAADVEAGWGGEAFGTGRGAMTVEGPWIVGALDADHPDVPWKGAELPEGPAGPGTLTFSNCSGMAADGDTQNAVELVKHFTSPEEQQAFTEAFGVSPSRISLEDWNAEAQPEKAAFNAGVDYAQAPVAARASPR